MAFAIWEDDVSREPSDEHEGTRKKPKENKRDIGSSLT
jgi:hypothetical protein